MKQILVLQNQRIGDTLQTTPLLVGLRQKHAPCRITLVANKMFADLKLHALVDEVIHFDQNGLFHALRDPQSDLVEKYDRVRAFLDKLRCRTFDIVVDVPADVHMHLLASTLMAAGEVRGAVLSHSRTWAYSHPEVILLYTIGLCREVNRFNLVDLYNLLAGVHSAPRKLHLPLDHDAEEYAERLLAAEGVDCKSRFLVALQAGASEERKRWGDSHFAHLARLLVERMGAAVLLCGSAGEKPSAERICREAGVPLISTVGQTSVSELAALVRRCHALVTNDTGTMHVAAAVGTPIVDLSTGPVFFRETGPYAEGSIVIEGDIGCSPCNFNAVCHHYSCRELITPEIVLKVVENIRQHRGWSSLEPHEFQGVKLHRAVFNDIGRLEFLPVFRYPLSFSQFLGFFFAQTWEVFYGLRALPGTTAELVTLIGSVHDIENSWGAIREEALRGCEDFCHLQQEIRAALGVLAPLIHSGGARNLSSDSLQGCDDLNEIFERILFFGQTHVLVRHFTAYLELALGSQTGIEPVHALRKIHEAFQFVSDQVEFLSGRLKEAVALVDSEYRAHSPQLVKLK